MKDIFSITGQLTKNSEPAVPVEMQMTLDTTAVTNAPTIVVPGAVQTSEDVAKPIPGIIAANADSVTLSADAALLTAAIVPNVTITGNATNRVVLAGRSEDINTSLAGLVLKSKADFNGADKLTALASSGTLTDSKAIDITVASVADVVNDAVSTKQDTPVAFNVLTNDKFSDPLAKLTGITAPSSGTVTAQSDGRVTYTPLAGWTGTATLSYTVTSGGKTETATVAIMVAPVSQVLPVITSLAAGNDNIPSKDIVEILWATTGATKAELTENAGTPIVVALSGSRHFYPAQTSVYRLKAFNAAGTVVEKSVTVNILGQPPAPPPPAPPPPPPPPPAPAPAPAPNDIVDASGVIIPAAYDAMYAAAVAQLDSFYDYKCGPAASVTTGGVALFERAHKKYPDNFGTGQERCVYEFGGPPTNDGGGMYSTNQASVACVQATVGCGVVEVQTSGFTNNTGQLKPQPQWQNGYALDNNRIADYVRAGIIPAGNAKPAFLISAADVHADNGPSRIACTVGGATGPALFSCGSTTANNAATLKLAANKLAVCGTMTVMGELAFIVLWDAATRKGQVAVIICGGTPDGVPWTQTTKGYNWWSEWGLCYPGLPNRGNSSFLKLLGYVDIPGMAAPTCCHVTTGYHPWQINGGDGQGIGFPSTPIENHYTELRDGGSNQKRIARGGLLAVSSKSEKKTVYFDLKNIFEWVYDSYLGVNHTRGERANLGMGDSQWPQVMSVSGVTMPVAKTLTFSSQITAQRFTATRPSSFADSQPPYHWTMTADGVCHTISVGTNYVPGVNAGRTGAPADIFEKSTMPGFGVVSQMAQMMGMNQTGNVDNNTGFWWVSRTNREVGYAKMNSDGTGGTIPLRFTPHASQCTDPIGIMDTDNYSNSANSINLFDYTGRRICGFRTDVLHHNGSWSAWAQNTAVTPTAGVPVEFNGAMAVSGKPVSGNSANVP